jgi:hypothetical protein
MTITDLIKNYEDRQDAKKAKMVELEIKKELKPTAEEKLIIELIRDKTKLLKQVEQLNRTLEEYRLNIEMMQGVLFQGKPS